MLKVPRTSEILGRSDFYLYMTPVLRHWGLSPTLGGGGTGEARGFPEMLSYASVERSAGRHVSRSKKDPGSGIFTDPGLAGFFLSKDPMDRGSSSLSFCVILWIFFLKNC